MDNKEQNNQSAMVMHWYPDYIINPIHSNRCVKIIVKESPMSLQGNWNTIVSEANNKAGKIKQIYEDSGNLWAQGKKVSDIDTSAIVENTKRIRKGDPIYACCLPLPNELTDTQNHNWSQDQSLISEFANGFLDSNISMKVPLTDKTIKTPSANRLTAAATHNFGFRKPMVDPGLFQNFAGSVPRGFSLSFDFIPNNGLEAKNIMNIILNLKKFALPRSVIDGVALLAPFTFEIEIGNDWMKKLINLNDVVVTGVTVNYGVDGGMQMFSNGMPKHITLQLEISERSLLTSEFYD